MPDLSPHLDLLAIMAHPDDAELLCGGTLARSVADGYRVGVLDLTGGESGTYGSVSERAEEAARAARALGLAIRENAGLPDAALENNPATRARVAALVRRLRPRTVILHARTGRHPDHRVASALGYDACYLAGLGSMAGGEQPHRPHKILYTLSYREDAPRPTFVVDTSDHIETKIMALRCYETQFGGRSWMGEVFPGGERPIEEQIRSLDARAGALIRRAYGEPFETVETMRVDDVVALPVSTY